MPLEKLHNDICNGQRLSQEEALRLLEENAPRALWDLAGRLRVAFHGRNIELCAILNARCGRCSEDCRWCAQSRFYNTGVEVTPLVETPQAVAAAQKAKQNGVHRFALVTSGRKVSPADIERLCAIYRQMREHPPRLAFLRLVRAFDPSRTGSSGRQRCEPLPLQPGNRALLLLQTLYHPHATGENGDPAQRPCSGNEPLLRRQWRNHRKSPCPRRSASRFLCRCQANGQGRGQISKPAVSKQIGNLEKMLGIRLLDRLPGGSG